MLSFSLPSFKKHLIKEKFPLLLVFIVLVVCILNFKSGTWLSGWDTVHPEFNYGEYWKRIWFSVWQEHQGLGAVATQSHAAEIPRMLILHILDLFFATSFVRWSYFFLMLILGPLGVYYLIKYLFSNSRYSQQASFLGALFYLFNLGTLQHFYVPLEMFATLYAFIGWLFLYLIRYIRKG